MQTIFELTIFLFLFELLEGYLQRASTLLEVLQKLKKYYTKSIFLFFLIHPGFYFLLFVVLQTNILNLTVVLMIAIKVFDIFLKLEILDQVFNQKTIPKELAQILIKKLPFWYFFLGAILYPTMLYYALS